MTQTEALRLALEALKKCQSALAEELSAWDIDPPLHHILESHDLCGPAIAACEAALEAKDERVECWCHKCNKNELVNGIPFAMTRMILCPNCGNKRCPKASDHTLQCTNSNKPNQDGSVYTTQPQRKPLTDEEIDQICGDVGYGYINVARAIEAKLKEKNS